MTLTRTTPSTSRLLVRKLLAIEKTLWSRSARARASDEPSGVSLLPVRPVTINGPAAGPAIA